MKRKSKQWAIYAILFLSVMVSMLSIWHSPPVLAQTQHKNAPWHDAFIHSALFRSPKGVISVRDHAYVSRIVERAFSIWRTRGRYTGNNNSNNLNTTQNRESKNSPQKTHTPDIQWGECALGFYGLPRAFRDLVLPSIVQHVLIPNAAHGCDIYVYAHALRQETKGRSGKGGSVDPNAIYLIQPASQAVSSQVQQDPSLHRSPYRNITVRIQQFTTSEFQRQRGPLLKKIHANHSRYMPPKAVNYRPSTLDNVIFMWHTVQGLWDLMMHNNATGDHTNPELQPTTRYKRIGIFRNDVIYTTPIDIFTIPPSNDCNRDIPQWDVTNSVAVIPGFARFPVNDRMFYGPTRAVKLYASQRFALMEQHVDAVQGQTRSGLHPEMLLDRTLFPKIQRELGVTIQDDPRICFVRARADSTVWMDDCRVRRRNSDPTPPLNETWALVEEAIHGKCQQLVGDTTKALCTTTR